MDKKNPKKIVIQSLKDMIEPTHKYRITTVDAVIVKENKVLLQKRSFGMFKGHWVLFGGKVDTGEDTWIAVVREAKEESGLDIRIIRMIGFYDDPKRDPEKNAVSMAFLCEPISGEIQHSEEASEIKWFPLDKLPEKMGFDHAKIISDAKKNLKR
jgi:8-oxo-dGTP diphosphatase